MNKDKFDSVENLKPTIKEEISLRVKMGYSRPDWKKIKKSHESIDQKLKSLIKMLVQELIILGKEPNSEEFNDLVNGYEVKWKDYIKKYILRQYPGSDRYEVRRKLFNLFRKKLNEVLE